MPPGTSRDDSEEDSVSECGPRMEGAVEKARVACNHIAEIVDSWDEWCDNRQVRDDLLEDLRHTVEVAAQYVERIREATDTLALEWEETKDKNDKEPLPITPWRCKAGGCKADSRLAAERRRHRDYDQGSSSEESSNDGDMK